ncbi:MAG TPA: site-2 protease family protein [bacterium]|nr:site-2 protease family protein [bacterium]
MLGFGDPLGIAITLAAVLVAATFHEFAHAFVADRLGDPTPRALGRLSLNPLVHLDLLGTLFFVVFGFGWARPVPVNPRHFADPRRGMLQVALAGPLANITLAFVVGALLKVPDLPGGPLAAEVLSALIWINVILALFNLIPIPPLDGSRILESLLVGRQALTYSRLQPYGTLLLLVLLYTGVVGRIMLPAARWLYHASTGGLPGL